MTRVILLGAPRSGTNMLRDILTTFEKIKTWPCDEINYIWRHGNIFFPSDAIPASLATPKIQRYIRHKFDLISPESDGNIVLEKTCANCLRVPFVEKIIPEAKYIYIYRDGIDAAVSAKARWTADLDIPYILQKARFVPKSDLMFYGLRYLKTRVYRLFSQQKRLSFWGPKLKDMDALLETYSLLEVCLIQWQRCVNSVEHTFQQIEPERIFRISYEDFVSHPDQELKKILQFLNHPYTESEIAAAVKDVSCNSLGKGRRSLHPSDIQTLENLVRPTLEQYGYL